jgi:3D (Asp-Asp-Asp) domain-containing protein
MALPNFPNNPTIGDIKIVGDATYECVATLPDAIWRLLSREDKTGTAPTLINVPFQYPTIADAMLSVKNKRIPVGATCTIKVGNGSYVLPSTLLLNHPDGDRLRIVGNETDETQCVLTLPSGVQPTFDMVVVSNGHRLGYFNGFYINIDVKATNYTGLLAVNGAFINCGTKVRVNNFYYGIAARVGSEIICNNAKVYNSGDVGIWAYINSTVQCNNAISNGAVDAANNLGFGIQAEFGSSIECTAASASGCRIAGIAALSNSLVRAHNANASSNLGSGFYASADGHIENHNATANSNTRYGEERVLNGTIAGSTVTLSSNALGSISPYAYFDNSGGLGARIASNGDLRVDTNGANNVYFNTSGGVQTQVAHASSSNSWPLLRGSALNQPGIESAGLAANIDHNIRPKGTGRVFLASQRPNYVAVSGASAGGVPQVSPEGSDPNSDILIKGKGTGMVRLGNHFAGSPAPNGYIEFKLEDGAIVRIPAQRV